MARHETIVQRWGRCSTERALGNTKRLEAQRDRGNVS